MPPNEQELSNGDSHPSGRENEGKIEFAVGIIERSPGAWLLGGAFLLFVGSRTLSLSLFGALIDTARLNLITASIFSGLGILLFVIGLTAVIKRNKWITNTKRFEGGMLALVGLVWLSLFVAALISHKERKNYFFDSWEYNWEDGTFDIKLNRRAFEGLEADKIVLAVRNVTKGTDYSDVASTDFTDPEKAPVIFPDQPIRDMKIKCPKVAKDCALGDRVQVLLILVRPERQLTHNFSISFFTEGDEALILEKVSDLAALKAPTAQNIVNAVKRANSELLAQEIVKQLSTH